MVTLLLVIIYIAFIALGLPDSLLGSAWSVIRSDLGADMGAAGVIYFMSAISTVVSSFFSSRILHKFGTAKVTTVSILLTSIALFGYSAAPNIYIMLLSATLLGFGAGSVDAALSGFIAMHYEARHMSWLHSFWGIGAMTGPLVMSLFLKNNGNWRGGYTVVALILFAVVVILAVSFPLWKIFESRLDSSVSEKYMTNKMAIRLRGVKPAMAVMLLYTGAEATMGLWIATFLIECRGVSAEDAAAFSALFYIGIISGRIIAGFLTFKLSSLSLIKYGALVSAVGLAVIVIFPFAPVSVAAVFLTGFGGAPIYPSIVQLTPARFGEKAAQSIVGLEMTSAYIGSSFLPMIIGFIGSRLGMWLVPVILLALVVLMNVFARYIGESKPQ